MPETPAPPFGATLDGVKALIPHAAVVETLGPGDRGVTAAQARAWVASLSSAVDLRLTGWNLLRAAPTAEETAAGQPAPQARLKAAAADLVHQGAASYLEAARFPERARPADTSYAEVLWRRYTEGLEALTAWLETELEDTEGGIVEGATAGLGIAYSFPEASFTPDAMRW